MTMQPVPHEDVILVVEDDEDLRDQLCLLLEDEGFRAVGVEHGQAALAWLQSHPPPCVILLDLMMPVMDGAEFRRHQTADPMLARVPTVVLSAMQAALQRAGVQGAASYLTKPVNPSRLCQTVRAHCPGTPDTAAC